MKSPLILAVVVVPFLINYCNAGVVVSDGVITDATLTVSGTTYNIILVEGSFTTVGNLYDMTSTPWYTGTSDFSTAQAFANELRNEAASSHDIIDRIAYYLFAYKPGSDPNEVSSFAVGINGAFETPYTTAAHSGIGIDDTKSGSFRTLYYATIVPPTATSVPEPSTAILMGLLGIVGFAGNRRRRRQVSVV
jgi:hypothetical protein